MTKTMWMTKRNFVDDAKNNVNDAKNNVNDDKKSL